MVGHAQGRQWNHAVPSLICWHRPVNILYTDYVEESIYNVSLTVERILFLEAIRISMQLVSYLPAH